MAQKKAKRTIEEINRKIKQGKVVVVTADEMAGIVKKKGAKRPQRAKRSCRGVAYLLLIIGSGEA